MLEMAMIRPPRSWAIMRRAASFEQRNTLLRLLRMMKSQSSSGVSTTGDWRIRPALFTRMSRPPSSLVGFAKRPGDLIGKADVALNGMGLAAALRDFVGDLLGLVEMQVEDRHFGPFANKRFDNRSTDPGGAAGDDGFLALQSHGFLLKQ